MTAQITRSRRSTGQPREARLRSQVAQELGPLVNELREWNTCQCPDCGAHVEAHPYCPITHLRHLPALYYALVGVEWHGDLPLGMGSTAAEALADLLWDLRTTRLLDDLRSF
jgi:hypothetical protein